MEIHKPILSKKELKELCDFVSHTVKSPLLQSLTVLAEIKRLQALTPDTEISLLEWQNLPENQVYLKIAKEFSTRKLKLRAARHEEKQAQLFFNLTNNVH